jgi:3-(3-hydroxy-phenyl)propionate hydroxylase
MTAALDLAHYGIPSIVLDEDNKLSDGSRAIAFHQSALAVWEKLGAAEAMLRMGVAWQVRHTYRGEKRLYRQDFGQPAAGYLPSYFNLPQFDVERLLLDRIKATSLIDMRWDHKVTGFSQDVDRCTLTVESSQGSEKLEGQYVLACDGARSTMRRLLSLDFPGRTFNDYFLIADIKADLNFEPEPRFYFDHPTNMGYTILIHPQPAGIWRIDWQIGSKSDPEVESSPEKMDKRIRALIGEIPYKIVWLSTYRFHQRLLAQLRHGRVFFAGDAAHLVAPFGARGMNSAVQDVENLVWKLAFVLKSLATSDLLETYQVERWAAQDENQKVTLATMRFMAPDTAWLKLRRNTILRLNEFYKPASKWVDSGRMSIPFVYKSPPLISSDLVGEKWDGAPALGEKLPDLPLILRSGGQIQTVFLRRLVGSGFVALFFVKKESGRNNILDWQNVLAKIPNEIPLKSYPILMDTEDFAEAILDPEGKLSKLMAAEAETLLLVRPDGHIAMRRRKANAGDLIEYFEKLGRQK